MAETKEAGSATNRHVVIVGGASGIGAATAAFLASRGWMVTVADNQRAEGEASAATVGGAYVFCDVGDEASVSAAADTADFRQPVRGMVMCAAVFEGPGRAEEASLDTLDAVFRINYRGTFISNRVFAQRMARRGGGAIVNLSSFGGLISSQSFAYGPMKAALALLTRNMAVEWGRSGVRVNAVSPGTTLVPKIVERLTTGSRYAASPERFSALGRLVEPEEVAAPIEFLLSDAASAITGVDLAVDAGMVPGLSWSLFGGVPPAR